MGWRTWFGIILLFAAFIEVLFLLKVSFIVEMSQGIFIGTIIVLLVLASLENLFYPHKQTA